MNALAIVRLPEQEQEQEQEGARLRVKNPYATANRLSTEQRVRAMVRCRLFSRETWRHAMNQFLADPATAGFAREEIKALAQR